MKALPQSALTWSVLAGVVLGCTTASVAQTVYRCGDSYSQVPCAGGRAMDASDARSTEDKRRADAATRESMAAANRMEHDRLAAEANRPAAYTRRPAPLGRNTVALAETVPPRRKKKTSKKLPPDYFTAAGPAAPKPAKAPKPSAE